MTEEKAENMVLRIVYLPKSLDMRLRAIAFTQDQSKAALMRALIQEALDHRASQNEIALADSKVKVKITNRSMIARSEKQAVAVDKVKRTWEPALRPERQRQNKAA